MARNGWFSASSRVRIYYDNGEPSVVATTFSNLDYAQNVAEQYVGRSLEIDTFFCEIDSPHLALIDPSCSPSDGFDWALDEWMLAGILDD